MRLHSALLVLSGLTIGEAAFQVPLSAFNEHGHHSNDRYEFKWPIQKVAIIGAGVGGLVSYRELTNAGLDAHIFERDYVPGGNWHYTDETHNDAPVPNVDPAVAAYTPSLPPKGKSLPYEEVYEDQETDEVFLRKRRDHRAPKPLWASLKSNAPAPFQQIRELPWPKGTPWELPRATLTQYTRAFASWHGINVNDENPNVSYNTRLELVQKRLNDHGDHVGWTLTLKKFVRVDKFTSKATWWTEDFDAIVVAIGRYNAPNIPDIKGLPEWTVLYPQSIQHSRQYRYPQTFTNKTVIVVGGGVSGIEIARDLNLHAKKVYLSTREDNSSAVHFPWSIFLGRLPRNTTLIGEIKKFEAGSTLDSGLVELTNGTALRGIDQVIFATGHVYSFPFLPQYHNSSLGPKDTVSGGPQPLVTDGSHIRSLYLDVFYIEEPTIGFVDMNIGVQSFTYSEFISLSLAKVWTGTAHLPSAAEQWRLHWNTVKERGGYGKHYLFLGATRTRELLSFFVAWLNGAAAIHGGRQIDNIPDNSEIMTIWGLARFGTNFGKYAGEFGSASLPFDVDACGGALGIQGLSEEEKKDCIHDAIFRDDW